MPTINTPDVMNNDIIMKRSLDVRGGVEFHAAINDDDIATDAEIASTKMLHRHAPLYSQPNTTATSVTHVIHIARGDGTIIAFRAGSIAIAVGGATVTVDLKKNGTTVLDSLITLDSGNTNRVAEAGDLVATPTYSAGDVLEIVTVATASGGTIPTGFFCQADLDEAAA